MAHRTSSREAGPRDTHTGGLGNRPQRESQLHEVQRNTCGDTQEGKAEQCTPGLHAQVRKAEAQWLPREASRHQEGPRDEVARPGEPGVPS